LYVATETGSLLAIDTATGLQKWTQQPGTSILTSPVVSGDSVYVATLDGTVHALDAATGVTRWSANPSSRK
jgi:outer membrane protein assembly factor BamB